MTWRVWRVFVDGFQKTPRARQVQTSLRIRRSIPRADFRWRLPRCAAQSGEKKIASIISYYAFPRPMPEREINLIFHFVTFWFCEICSIRSKKMLFLVHSSPMFVFIQAVGGTMNQRQFRNARIFCDCEIVWSWTWATYLGWETGRRKWKFDPFVGSLRSSPVAIINISPLTQKETSASESDFHTITHEIHVIAYIFLAPFPRDRGIELLHNCAIYTSETADVWLHSPSRANRPI